MCHVWGVGTAFPKAKVFFEKVSGTHGRGYQSLCNPATSFPAGGVLSRKHVQHLGPIPNCQEVSGKHLSLAASATIYIIPICPHKEGHDLHSSPGAIWYAFYGSHNVLHFCGVRGKGTCIA